MVRIKFSNVHNMPIRIIYLPSGVYDLRLCFLALSLLLLLLLENLLRESSLPKSHSRTGISFFLLSSLSLSLILASPLTGSYQKQRNISSIFKVKILNFNIPCFLFQVTFQRELQESEQDSSPSLSLPLLRNL